jgi:hypothetical protein
VASVKNKCANYLAFLEFVGDGFVCFFSLQNLPESMAGGLLAMIRFRLWKIIFRPLEIYINSFLIHFIEGSLFLYKFLYKFDPNVWFNNFNISMVDMMQ